ncbi:MAG: hypothetical protein SPK76_03225 [Bacteroidales bacterium]|nr:hypothetical protein [Bacteroidales bacterium]
MSYSGDILSRPMTWGQMQAAFGVSTTSMKALLTGGVNKWARRQGFVNGTRFADFYDSGGSSRLAGQKAANLGLRIPSYVSASAFRVGILAASAGAHWTRQRPDGVSAGQWIRGMDYDGYANDAKTAQEWNLSGGSSQALNFPFNGTVYLPGGNTLGPGSTVNVTMDPADPDQGATGLLYPADFDGAPAGLYDYYLGLAVISAAGSGDFYVTDSATLRQRASWGASASITLTLGTELSDGSYYLVPILCSKASPSATSLMAASNWWGEGASYIGRAVSVDGYRLAVTYNASTPAFTVSFGTIYADGNTMKVPVTLRNTTGSAVTLSTVFTYIESEGVFDTYAEHAAVEAGVQAWVNSGTRHTGGISYGGNVVAAYKAQSAVTVPAGTTQTVTLTVADSLADAQGYDYDDHSTVYLCVQQGSERKVY